MVNKINIKVRIEYILLLISVLCVTTPLFFYSSGYVIIAISLWIILYNALKKISYFDYGLMICIFIALFCIFVLTTNILNGNERWKMPLVSTLLLTAFYILSYKSDAGTYHFHGPSWIINVLYYVVWVWGMRILLNFKMGISVKYAYDMHYVDFSLLMIFIFMLGVKIKHYKSTLILTIMTWISVPARMYKMYVILYLLVYIFYQQYTRIRKKKIFNTYLKIALWLIIAFTLFALLWEFVLTKIFVVKDYHTGLFDTSNAERIRTVIYGLSVILKKCLILNGIPISSGLEYSQMSNILDGITNIPHNSYYEMIINNGLFYTSLYLVLLTRIFDRVSSKTNDAIIFSYLICACILHYTLVGYRIFLMLSVLMLPDYIGNRDLHLVKGKICINQKDNKNVREAKK